MILEKDLEKKVGRYARTRGVRYFKFQSPANRGVADRLLVCPNGKVGFLELKRAGEKPTALQLRFLADMTACGVPATWADNYADAVGFINRLLPVDPLS